MNKSDNSEIVHHAGGTSFVGKDAVNLYRAVVLKSSLQLYAKTKLLPTRGVSASAMLKMASEYTGKQYKRGQYTQAADDMHVWIETMKAALPVSEG